MTDFLSRIGQFVRSHTPVQRSKSQENEQPMEKRAAGKRSHSLASRSSVKSLKSRMVSIGSPKKNTKPSPPNKPKLDPATALQLTPDEYFGIEARPEPKVRPLPVQDSVDREIEDLIRGLNDEELLLSFDPKRIAADAEPEQAPKLAHRPLPLEASARRDFTSAASEAEDAINKAEAELNRTLADAERNSAADLAQKSVNSIPRERAMPAPQRVIQRGLPRRAAHHAPPPNATSPEQRGPVGRAAPAARPPENRGGEQ